MIQEELNQIVVDIPEALSIYINQLVYSEKRLGIDVTTLSLGEAFFDIPQFSFDEIDFVKGYHYSDSMGLPELRKKIMEYYNKNYNASIQSIDNIMISSGSKAIIFMVMLLLLKNGDDVLIHEPAWLSYQEQAKLAGGIPKFIPYDTGLEDFQNFLTEDTKLLILNNPNNPAGWVYDADKLRELYQICLKKHIYILMDEAYSDFIQADEKFVSLSCIAKDLEGVIIVNSLSKNMGMSGWRIGYMIAQEEIIFQALKLNQHIITCAPTILQMYISRYFDDIISVTLPQAKNVVEKRSRMIEYLDSIGLGHLNGGSTFYIFIDVRDLKVPVLDFCLYLLLKYGIAVVPGSAYGKSTAGFIRVGIGVESEERIVRAFDIIKLVYEQQLTDVDYISKRLKSKGYRRFKAG